MDENFLRGRDLFNLLFAARAKSDISMDLFYSWSLPIPLSLRGTLTTQWLCPGSSIPWIIPLLRSIYPTTKAIWDAVTMAFSDLEDSSQMFHLRNHCRLLHQGDLNVTQYFNTLTKLRQELDLFNPKDWHDPKDATIYRNFLTRERTYDFLASLDRSLDDIRGRILSVKPLPLIDEIFAKVCREESCKHVMLGPLSLLQEA